ncbi:uncharacterized protein LOC143592592 [Bidens hawaiensis]|uniref:uncharacterized protein LOC143592592 n=1 Tax=Bidens hawaiensis TaxID=980011 RepID=UPI00404B1A5D
MSSNSSRKRSRNLSPSYDGFASFEQRQRHESMLRASTSRVSAYIDLGDCRCVCQFCGAYFWYAERSLSASRNDNPCYTQCCKGGDIKLPFFRSYSPAIVQLYDQPHFLSNIRAYNSMFSMTSFGAKVDDSINKSSSPYVFKIEGQIHHWLGSLCPPPNEKPRFLQIYIYDTDNEVSNRLRFFSGDKESTISPDVVSLLITELESKNELVKLFRTARDICQSNELPTFSIRLYAGPPERCYDTPVSDCIGAIIADDDPSTDRYDIVIRHKDGSPQRISKLHQLYMPLQYPLLFIYGESGWSPRLRLRRQASNCERNLTMNMYYSYLLHDRRGRLFQQYLVDAYVCIEESRLEYIRQNQKTFRTEFLQGLNDAIRRGDTNGRDIGKRMILPSSFTGGPGYMYKHYQDALAICHFFRITVIIRPHASVL